MLLPYTKGPVWDWVRQKHVDQNQPHPHPWWDSPFFSAAMVQTGLKSYWFNVFCSTLFETLLFLFMQDTVLELEFQGIQKQFTMLQVKKTNSFMNMEL